MSFDHACVGYSWCVNPYSRFWGRVPALFVCRVRNDESNESKLELVSMRTLLSVPKITHLNATSGRVGSTVIPTLLSGFSGEQIGASNRDNMKRLEIPRNGYRFSLITGIQPANASLLFDNAGSGFPQRFLWMNVLDPDTPIKDEDTEKVLKSLTCSPYLSFELPGDSDKSVVEAYYNQYGDFTSVKGQEGYLSATVTMTFPDIVKREFSEERIRGIVVCNGMNLILTRFWLEARWPRCSRSLTIRQTDFTLVKRTGKMRISCLRLECIPNRVHGSDELRAQ